MSLPFGQPLTGYVPLLSPPIQSAPQSFGYFHSGGSESGDSPLSEVPPHLQTQQMLPPHPGFYPGYGFPGQSGVPPPFTGWPPEKPPAQRSGPAKTSRSQFSACGACRHRRVKCDLKLKQDELERLGQTASKGKGRAKLAACTNCLERGVLCVDEFAPMKAAKQLRRGKRINEVEQLYGKAEVRSAHPSNSSSSQGNDPQSFNDEPSLPELTPAFFESAFFKRLLIQRPVIDPVAFPRRYLSSPYPCASAMGPEGAILCHVLFSWAASYGVNERGELDVPEGGGGDETEREAHREARRRNTQSAIRVVLKEIDDAAIMRRPSWDGVRCMLLVLPLTEGVAQPLERLAMYECAVGQVYSLCSFAAINYDGLPASASAANGGSESADGHLVRVRIYWYAFVHEGITTGLKGGRMILDEEDMDTLQDALQAQGALVKTSALYRKAAMLATAPVRLAIACRLIHRALTGPRARKRASVDPAMLQEAWEALEKCWEEFEGIRWSGASSGVQEEELVRFADGWKIFLFEAQNVIRESLEHRLTHLTATAQTAHLSDLSVGEDDSKHQTYLDIQHLYEIARSKCEVKTKQVIEIVRQHLGSRFFEWDASLVRDGTYYCALLLAKEKGSPEDISVCLQALNELRWGFAKARERSENLRRVWATREGAASLHNPDGPWHPVSLPSSVDTFDVLNMPKLNERYEPPSEPSTGLASPAYDRLHYAPLPHLRDGSDGTFDRDDQWQFEPKLEIPLPYGYLAQTPQFTPPIINNDVSYFPPVHYDQQYAEGYSYVPVQMQQPPPGPYQ